MQHARALLPLASALVACSGPTQLVVVVQTNLEVPSELDSVEVVVTGPTGVQTLTSQPVGGPADASFPLTLGVSPSGDRLGPISVAAVGRLAGAEVVRSTATGLTLVPGETRVLQLVLLRSCVGRACGPGESCGVEGCAEAATDAASLPAWDGSPPPFDGSDRCLSAPWDADGDGQGDVACGGRDCDDGRPLTFAGATEQCDGRDDDCDGTVDEDCGCAPIGAVEACPTSCGSVGTRRCEEGGWSSCAPPEESCDGRDDDCDGTADEGFEYVAGAPIHVSGSSPSPDSAANEPTIVSAGGGYAVAWNDRMPTDGVYLSILSGDGTSAGPPLLLGPGRTPAIAAGGSLLAVAWWYELNAGTRRPTDVIYLRLLSTGGEPLGAAMEIEGDADRDPRPRVVWDGEAFVVSYADGGLVYRRFGPDGVEIGTPFMVPGRRAGRADLTFDGTGYGFAWGRGGDVYFTRGSETAGFPPTPAIVAAGEGGSGTGMAWTGDGFLLAWRAGNTSPPVRALALDAAGAPRGPSFELSPTGASAGSRFPNRTWIEVAAAAGQTLVAWPDTRDGDTAIYAARLAPDGTVLQAPFRVAGAPPALGDVPGATWDGAGFAVVWEEQGSLRRSGVLLSQLRCP